MSHSELIQVLMFISSAYPGKLKYPSRDHTVDEALEETWMIFLKDYDFKLVMSAVKDYIPNSPEWPPTVGQVVNTVKDYKYMLLKEKICREQKKIEKNENAHLLKSPNKGSL